MERVVLEGEDSSAAARGNSRPVVDHRLFAPDASLTSESTRGFLQKFMEAFGVWITITGAR
jgi:hypothetical protein